MRYGLNKLFLFILLSLWCSLSFAQEVISSFNDQNISVLNEELRNLRRKINGVPTYSTSLESQYPATDDTVLIGDGTIYHSVTIPNCTTGVLQYTQATNAWNCGTPAVYGWEYIESAVFDATSVSPLVITETLSSGYAYKVILAGYSYGTGGAVVINFKLNTTAIALVADVKVSATLHPFMAEGMVFYNTDANITVAGFSNGIYRDESEDIYKAWENIHSIAAQATSMSFYPVDAGPHLAGRYFLYRTKQ